MRCKWQVVPLWTLRAEDLLALNDVGVIPWVPLAQTSAPVLDLLRTCRERIEQQGHPDEQDNLIAVTQVMTFLRYNDRSLLSFIGGKKVITDTPLIQEILAENMQEGILDALQAKFGQVPPEVAAKVRAIQDVPLLRQLNTRAAVCTDLEAFRTLLPS
jgi:predicted transposase YdaD